MFPAIKEKRAPSKEDALSVDHLHTDLKGRSVRGGVLSVAAQGAQFILQSIATVVLARLLTPVDFGLVAMVTAITVIAAGFADLGLTEATIQRPQISHSQVSTLFWINVGIGLAFTLITAALAPVVAWFYKQPQLVGITLAVSLSFLIGGLRGQHTALLKRQMRFSWLAMRDVASCAIAVPVSILMASRGAGYWAIVALPIASNSMQTLISWLMLDWRPGLPSGDAEVRSMVSFGSKVATSYVIFNWVRNADNVLVGWYWGAGPLGLYSRAYNLVTLAVTQLNAPVATVAIPALSRIQGDPELFARYYLRVANLIMWVSAPLFGFLFVAAKPLILLTLGPKWLQAAPIFRVLAVSALGQVLWETMLWLFISRGQSTRLLKLFLAISPVIIASFVVGLPFGIKRVALSFSIVLLAILPLMLSYTFRGTNLSLRRLGRALVCPISICLSGVFLSEIAVLLFPTDRTLSQALVAGIGFVGAYALSALVPQVRHEFMSIRNLSRELRPSS